MDRRARQRRVGRRCGEVSLVGELVFHHRCLRRVEMGDDDRHGLDPPVEAAQVGLRRREVAHREMHAGEHPADAAAVVGVRGQVMLAGQAIDDGRGLVLQREHEGAIRVGVRQRHGQAALGEMLHQLQVERQLAGAQALEQREHVAARRRVGEVVGVLDAAGAWREGLQRPRAPGGRSMPPLRRTTPRCRPPSARIRNAGRSRPACRRPRPGRRCRRRRCRASRRGSAPRSSAPGPCCRR